MSQKREMEKLARAYRAKGWIVTRTSRHLRWQAPNGAVVYGSSTPGGLRSIKNFKAQLKRAKRGGFAMITVRNDCGERSNET